MSHKVEISYKTIILTIGTILSLWLLYFIKDIILEFFLALLIMTILNPLVSKLAKQNIPRGVSVLITYIIVFGLLGGVIAGIIPALIEQSTSFAYNLPKYLNNLGLNPLVRDQVIDQFFSQIGNLPSQIIKVSISIFSNFISVISILIFSFYLLLMEEKLDDKLSYFLGESKRKTIVKIINLMEFRLGGWARGELILMGMIGVFSYIGLTLLGIPFALPLAILAGLLEIVPYFGPIISSIPAVIIGLSISPLTGLAVIALAFIIHQLENYVFVPKIMEKSVGVSPIATLLALAIGFRLIGISGAIIAVPIVITLQVLSKEFFPHSK
jgi:predicted PurR-regulated permease PerM